MLEGFLQWHHAATLVAVPEAPPCTALRLTRAVTLHGTLFMRPTAAGSADAPSPNVAGTPALLGREGLDAVVL